MAAEPSVGRAPEGRAPEGRYDERDRDGRPYRKKKRGSMLEDLFDL